MMSDATIATIVTGVVTISSLFIGFLTLWVKLKYSADKAEEAATKAAVVEGKLDANTATTNLVDTKTDTIVKQTNGTLDRMRDLLEGVVIRVDKLEAYNRESSHRLFDTVHALGLKVERLLAVQEAQREDLAKAPPKS